jgi:perosamine synthetase
MIPVAIPYVAKNSEKYAVQAIRDAALSGLYGEHLPRFEKAFADYVGVRHAVTCSNGTTAIHLALAAHGIGPGDEVLVSALTNMATFFAVLYCGATPVPVDVDPFTYALLVEDFEKKITAKSKAAIIVHLFGQPADMPAIMDIADQRRIAVFEDCAESHGASIAGKQTGAWGLAGCFSLFANKNINTGEGGIVTTDDGRLAEHMRSMKSLSFGKTDKFLHPEIGFNYRMDNVKAALGCAQMEEVDEIIAAKLRMGQYYDELFRGDNRLILPVKRPNIKNTYWMYHIRLHETLAPRRNEILEKLAAEGIETRPGFVSYTLQPFANKDVVRDNPCPNAEQLSYATFYIPSSHSITEQTQQAVAKALKAALDEVS